MKHIHPNEYRFWRDPRIWLGALISLLLIWLALQGTDPAGIVRAIRDMDYKVLPTTILLTYLILFLRSLRWHILLRGVGEVSQSYVFKASLIGYTINYIIPIRAGELIRAYLVGTNAGFSRSAAMATVVVERVIDVLSILFIFALFIPFVQFPEADEGLVDLMRSSTLALSAVGFIVFTLIIVLYLHTEFVVLFLERMFGRILPSITCHTWRISAFATGLGFGKNRLDVVWLILLTTVIWALTIIQIMILASGFNFFIPWICGLLMLIALAVGVSVPSAPGMVGTFHYAVIAVLLVYGVDREQAVSYAVVLHAASVFPILFAGLFLVWLSGFSLKTLLAESKSNKDPTH